MREMATDVVLLHKMYLSSNSGKQGNTSKSGGKEIVAYTQNAGRLNGDTDINLEYSDVQLNYLCDYVSQEFLEPQFAEVSWS